MLGCVHPLKALDEAASFRCWEGLVERRLGVDVQVVLKQRDQVGVREVVVGDLLENVGIIPKAPVPDSRTIPPITFIGMRD